MSLPPTVPGIPVANANNNAGLPPCFLGLDNAEHVRTVETHWTVTTSVVANDPPVCPKCGPHKRMESKGFANRRVLDTPSRGKPTILLIERRRYKCLICNASMTQAGPAVGKGPIKSGRKKITKRLLLYIQNQVTKRPVGHVAKETGVAEGTVRDIALELSRALMKYHRFPVPSVLGMDGLKINKTWYMVVGDADEGHLIAIVEAATTPVVNKWIKEYGLDVKAVDVFVTDMHSVNVSLAANEFKHALHIADKWHIIHNYRKVLSRTVDVAVSDLRDRKEPKGIKHNPELAQDIDDLKPAIMSISHNRLRRRRRHRRGEQIEIDFGKDLKPIIDKVDTLSRAYWARYDLVEMYKSATVAEAMVHRDRFLDRITPLLADDSLAPDVKRYIGHLTNNEKAVFNYFKRISLRADGTTRGPTTNALEQRNSMIRAIWRSGKGISTLPLIRLRAIYGQWNIGLDIVQCAEPNCPLFHGPLIGPIVPLHIVRPGGGWRCSTHAI